MANQPVYLPAPWPSASYTDGLMPIYEINGLLINDQQYTADMLRVIEVSGLEGAEIRDSREVLPGMDGEEAFSAWYSGRTIILGGVIDCGNWAMLQTMKNNLLAATNMLVETPLYMHRFDFLDHFNQNKLGTYTSDGTGSVANLTLTGGLLKATASYTSVYRLVVPSRAHEDHAAHVTVIPGQTINDNFEGGVVLKRTASGTYLYCALRHSTSTGSYLAIQRYVSGTPVTIATFPVPTITTGTRYVVEGRISGDNVTATLYLGSMDVSRPDANVIASGSVATGDSGNFGPGVTGYAGWRFVPVDQYAALDDFQTVAGSPPFDVWTRVRKSQPVSIGDQQLSLTFRRPFLLTLRASDPRFFSKFLASESVELATSGAINQARFYGRGYDLGYSGYVDDSGVPVYGENILSVTNYGNYYATPVIRLVGDMTNPTLLHSSGTMMTLTGQIPDGDYWDIDVTNRTILDGNGVNQFSALSYDSDWIMLEPGDNVISLTAEYFVEGTAQLQIYYRHAWL